jgi:hypothetical protein
VNDLTGADGLSGFLELGEEVQIRIDFVASNTDNNESEVELFEILLVLQVAINRHEDIELLLGQDEQGAVVSAAPATLSNRFDRVAGERSADTGVDALV